MKSGEPTKINLAFPPSDITWSGKIINQEAKFCLCPMFNLQATQLAQIITPSGKTGTKCQIIDCSGKYHVQSFDYTFGKSKFTTRIMKASAGMT